MLYFKPRRCFRCEKRAFLAVRKTQVLCNKCRQTALKTEVDPFPKNYSSMKYRVQKAKLFKKVGMCELCGSTENLSAHHIGGRADLGLTCLCLECHRAYEKWNMTGRKKDREERFEKNGWRIYRKPKRKEKR